MELSETLAKWAGVEPYAVCPTGFGYPDFDESLDACFECLVPKAIKKIVDEYECNISLAYARLFKWWRKKLKYDPTNPALALCKAIEEKVAREGSGKIKQAGCCYPSKKGREIMAGVL